MSKSKIEWTGRVWNPYRMMHNPNNKIRSRYEGTAKKMANGEINWSGRVNVLQDLFHYPLNIKKPDIFFVNSMSDLYHSAIEWNDLYKIFEVMHLAYWHKFQVLTKRPERMEKVMPDIYFHLKRNYPDAEFPSKNVWLGVSVENQEAANKRIPFLFKTAAAKRFLSCEPLLGPVDLQSYYFEKANGEYAFNR